MGHRRSGIPAQRWDQLDLLPLEEGVGGRHGHGYDHEGGGGYLDGCTPSELRQRPAKKKFSEFSQVSQLDPREAALLDELDSMGMPDWMLQIAQAIGVDHTLTMWRILDAQRGRRSDDGLMINLQLRPFSSYRRYQRNRFIEALGAVGFSVDEIRSKVKRELGEELSRRHILRLTTPSRVKP